MSHVDGEIIRRPPGAAFPGGNFVSAYESRYGVGDIDKRPPIFDSVWRAVQPNDIG